MSGLAGGFGIGIPKSTGFQDLDVVIVQTPFVDVTFITNNPSTVWPFILNTEPTSILSHGHVISFTWKLIICASTWYPSLTNN